MKFSNPFASLLAKKTISSGKTGLYWVDGRIVICHVTNPASNRFILEKCLIKEWDPMVDGVEGMANLLKQENLAETTTVLCLELGTYDLFPFDAPKVPWEEMIHTIRFMVCDKLNYPEKDLVVDCFKIPPVTRGAALSKIYVVATQKEVIQSKVDVLHELPIRLDAIEIPEISIHYLIGGMLAESEKGVAFLYLARNGKGFILISHMEQIYLARQTTVELSNQPGIAFAAMEKLALEVQRSLEYYQNTYGAQPVATLLVAAQHNPDYFVNEMAERLDLSVKLLDLSKLVSGLEIIPKDAFGLCLPAICAAMRPVVVVAP